MKQCLAFAVALLSLPFASMGNASEVRSYSRAEDQSYSQRRKGWFESIRQEELAYYEKLKLQLEEGLSGFIVQYGLTIKSKRYTKNA